MHYHYHYKITCSLVYINEITNKIGKFLSETLIDLLALFPFRKSRRIFVGRAKATSFQEIEGWQKGVRREEGEGGGGEAPPSQK